MQHQLAKVPAFNQALLAALLTAAYSNASALDLPGFTWNPAAVGLAGSSFTADNIIVSDFATVTFTSAATFHEDGYLSVAGFQNNGQGVNAPGLNSTYSLYFRFTADGINNGPLTSFEFQMFGTNSRPTFGPGGTISGAVNPIQLATGSLASGGTGTINGLPGAAATVSWRPLFSQFYPNPSPFNFYQLATTSFVNAEGTVTNTPNGFMIDNGGGSIHFIPGIPEPETYALMMAGLGVAGFVAWRRKAATTA